MAVDIFGNHNTPPIRYHIYRIIQMIFPNNQSYLVKNGIKYRDLLRHPLQGILIAFYFITVHDPIHNSNINSRRTMANTQFFNYSNFIILGVTDFQIFI